MVIPKELRDAMHLAAGDLLEIEGGGESITLRPARDEGPLVKKQGVWVHRGGGTLSLDDVNRAIAQGHAEREQRLITPHRKSNGDGVKH